MPKWGLTDLERGKYTDDSTGETSTVRVRPDSVVPVSFDQPIDARIVEQPILSKPVSFSSIPRETYRFGFSYLTNPLDASENNINQNINGATTPVEFLFTPNNLVLVEQITVVVISTTIVTMLDYFSVPSLTNGVLLFTREGGIEYPFFNIRRAIEYAHPSDIGISNIRITGFRARKQ